MANFGVGYTLNIENQNFLKEAKEMTKELHNIAGEIKYDYSSLQQNKRVIYKVPICEKDKMGKILKYFEERGIKYGIEGNTLEDAFIELANKKKNEDAEMRQALYSTIFMHEYSTNFVRLTIALSYRRFALMFSSPILIIKFLSASLLPPIFIFAGQGGSPLTMNVVYALPAGTVIIFLFIISFFAHLPWEERKTRLRYILKMLGTDTFTYYFNMLICDTIYLTIIVCLNFFFLFLFNLNNLKEMKEIVMNISNIFFTA